ncbi:MAG: hypothetical protein V3U07_09060 [Nitrospirales bacterium]
MKQIGPPFASPMIRRNGRNLDRQLSPSVALQHIRQTMIVLRN